MTIDPYYKKVKWNWRFTGGSNIDKEEVRDNTVVVTRALKGAPLKMHRVLNPAYPIYSIEASRSAFFYESYIKLTTPQTIVNLTPDGNMYNILGALKPWLDILGPRLSRDTKLLTKLIRIGRAYLFEAKSKVDELQTSALNSASSTNNQSDSMEVEKDTPTSNSTEQLRLAHEEYKKVEAQWIAALLEWIIPAFTQASSNPGLSNELWDMLSLIPYTTRYAIYRKWEHTVYKSSRAQSNRKNHHSRSTLSNA